MRIEDLSGKYAGRFVGPYAYGKPLGTDTIYGREVPVFSELALPAATPSAAAAAGWGIFPVRQGIDARFTCAAIQIDTASGTEVILGD